MMLAELLPDDTPVYMFDAWLSCMVWAIGNPEIMDAFRRETGNHWQPARCPLDQLIDITTGAQEDFVASFVRWANVNVWGPIEVDMDSAEPPK